MPWDALGRSGVLWDALEGYGTPYRDLIGYLIGCSISTLSRPYRDLIGCPRSQIIVWRCVSGPTLSRPYWVPYWVNLRIYGFTEPVEPIQNNNPIKKHILGRYGALWEARGAFWDALGRSGALWEAL